MRREEALMVEATERSLELERLEMRERQVAEAEDAASAREARTQEEADRRVAEASADLANRYNLKLKLMEAEGVGRTAALRSGLAEAEQRDKAATAALISVQAELASPMPAALSSTAGCHCRVLRTTKQGGGTSPADATA